MGFWLLMSLVIQGKVSQRGRHFLRLICKRLVTILSGLLLIKCYIDLSLVPSEEDGYVEKSSRHSFERTGGPTYVNICVLVD